MSVLGNRKFVVQMLQAIGIVSQFTPRPFRRTVESLDGLFHVSPSSKSLFLLHDLIDWVGPKNAFLHTIHIQQRRARVEKRWEKSSASSTEIRDGHPLEIFLHSTFHPKYCTSERTNMHRMIHALSGIDFQLVSPVSMHIDLTSSVLKFPSNLLLPSKCPPRFFHFSLVSLSCWSHSHIQRINVCSLEWGWGWL